MLNQPVYHLHHLTISQDFFFYLNFEKKKYLTSETSLEDGALLPLPAVSLVGTTVICCIGMLLFPGNAPAPLPPLHYSLSIPRALPVLQSLSPPPRSPVPSTACLRFSL